jgi:hypothetical protein
MRYRMRVLLIAMLGITLGAFGQKVELNTALMESTFKIQGAARGNPQLISLGTAFFLGRNAGTNPSQSYFVLVTARHVLEGIADEDTILLREKTSDGTFRKVPHTFKIRDNGKDLYVHHGEADVAAMYFAMPMKDPFTLINMDFLANDDRLKLFEIHPGDELVCLGFPLAAEANDMGFPILRSGRIASYPLVPTKDIKSFLYDFHVLEGNSGGPVYFTYDTRYFGGALKAGGIEGIIGLVSEERYSAVPGHVGERLNLGVIVPSTFIIETINMLPEKIRTGDK